MLTLNDQMLELFKSTPGIGVVVYQDEGLLVYVNDGFCAFTEYDHDELVGKKRIHELVEGKTRPTVRRVVKRRLSGEDFSWESNELVYVTKKGHLKPSLNFGYTVLYRSKPSGFVVVIDVVKQKTFEMLYRSLSEINRLVYSSNNETELFEKVCGVLTNQMEFDLSCVGRIDEESKLFEIICVQGNKRDVELLRRSVISVDPSRKEGRGTVGRAYRMKRIVALNDIYSDNGMSAWRSYQKKAGVYSVCSVPLMKSDKVEYILVLYSRIPDIFSNEYLFLIRDLQESLNSFLKNVDTIRWNAIFRKAIDAGFDYVIVTDDQLRIRYINDNVENVLGHSFKDIYMKPLSYLSSEFQETKDGSAFGFYRDILSGGSFFRIVPIRHKNGTEIKSVLVHVSRVPSDSAESGYFMIIAAKDITGDVELKKAIEYSMNRDSLTNLLNRDAFAAAIDRFIVRARYKGLKGAVLIINPVKFSQINEAFGYKIGNKVLIEIANRLSSRLRDYDVVAKLESSNFGVLLKDIKHEGDALMAGMHLLNHLTKPYRVGVHQIAIEFSVGMSIFPDDAGEAEELIEKANIALRDAKTKNSAFGFYKEELKQQAYKRVTLKMELAEALKKDSFVMYYQPYFEAKSHRLAGAEALVRLIKGTSVITPAHFIPFMEELNMIQELEKRVVSYVLEDINRVVSQTAPLPVTINLSPQSLNDDGFVDDVLREIGITVSDKKLVNIEITERLFINDKKRAREILKLFSSKGIRIFVDDFGTGYSSLSYISELPVDFVKIDLSFTQHLHDKRTLAVVKTIVYMAKELDLKTVAEGVETEEQMRMLEEIGCDYLQGYLLGRPVPLIKWIEMLKQFHS